jgi:hypothetical protein
MWRVKHLYWALALPLLVACPASKSESPAASDGAASASVRRAPPARSSWPIPGGPRLAILAGQGIGPIRFGATVPTIERHMQAPCDVKTETVCRYFARAVEFELAGGVLNAIKIHRMDRPAGNDGSGKARRYGVFNGAIPPDLSFGMLPEAIQKVLGPPKRIEKVEQGGENRTRELHHYDGMILEFDNLQDDLLALGAVRLMKR